jgi:SSS family solute:Na+ symporter
MVLAVVSIGIEVPHIYFGGIAPMFAALARVKPAHLVMPGATNNLGHAWYISTVLLTSLGALMWPHLFGASFTARSADTLRRNAVVMPLYSISLAFIFFIGFAAVLVVPGLSDGDLSLLTVVRKAFPAWMLGLIGGAGALTAMVPAAILVLTASTLFAKNLYRPIFAPEMTDDHVARLARIMVVALSLISLYFAVYSSPPAAGICRRGAILSRRRAWPFLEARHDGRRLWWDDGWCCLHHIFGPQQEGPLRWVERRLYRFVRQLCNHCSG